MKRLLCWLFGHPWQFISVEIEPVASLITAHANFSCKRCGFMIRENAWRVQGAGHVGAMLQYYWPEKRPKAIK